MTDDGLGQKQSVLAVSSRFGGIGRALLAIACLDAFLVALPLLGAFRDIGEGLGGQLLQQMAGYPIVGLFLGILVTSIIQSSSSTTSLVVGLAAAGAIGSDPQKALAFAVPVVMGANIGTAVTNTIVSMAHIGTPKEFGRAFGCAVLHDLFNVYTVAILIPLQLLTNFLGRASWAAAGVFQAVGGLRFTSPLKIVISPQARAVKALFGHPWAAHAALDLLFALLFLSAIVRLVRRSSEGRVVWPLMVGMAAAFAALVEAIRSVPQLVYASPTATFATGGAVLVLSLVTLVKLMRTLMATKLERLIHGYIFKTTLRALLFGAIVTAVVQSSSVTTSAVVPLAGAGILGLERIYPYTLGANVGTTVTAMLAALSLGEPLGIAVALAHLGFNIVGISVFLPLRRLPIGSARWLAAQANRSRAIPILFLIGVYYIIPLALILGLRLR
jgi:sodium-dependent phosphate cotransporter